MSEHHSKTGPDSGSGGRIVTPACPDRDRGPFLDLAGRTRSSAHV
ncbi:hypothetical protein [Streptomyces hokutonensis]